MGGSIVDKVRAGLGIDRRGWLPSRLATESRGLDGAWPSGNDPDAATALPNRRSLARAAVPFRTSRRAERPFIPFACRETYCHHRFDLAANGK